MSTYDPAKTRVRIGLADAAEIGEPRLASGATWHQPRPAELGTTATRNQIASNAIASGGLRQKSRGGTVETTVEPVFELDPHTCALPMTAALGYVTTEVDTPVAGAYTHTISQGGGDLDLTARRLIWQMHLQDSETVATSPGLTCAGFVLSVETDSLVTFQPKGAASSYSSWGPATRTSGTGTSPVCYLRGAQTKARARADKDLVVEVSKPSGTAGFDVDLLIYDVGDTPGATVVPVKLGFWHEVVLSDGTIPGLGPADVEIMLPVPAAPGDLDDGDVFTVHRIYRPGDLWATALPSPSGMSSVYAKIFLDGERLGSGNGAKAESLEIDFGPDATTLNGVDGVFGRTVSRGAKGADITISRQYLDEDHKLRLLSGESVHLRVLLETPEEIAPGVRYSVELIMPACSPSGDVPLPADPEDWPEEIVLSAEEAETPDDEGFTDPVTVRIVNAAASIV